MEVSEVFNAPDGSFSKAVQKKGSGMYTPTDGSSCKVLLSPTSPDGLDLVSLGMYTGEVIQIIIGEGDSDVRDIIDRCLKTMSQGEICCLMFYISGGKVEYNSFENNCEPATIEIQLIDFNRVPLYKMDNQTKFDYGQHHKDKGTEQFKLGNKDAAFRRYKLSMKYVISICNYNEESQELKEKTKGLRSQLHLNLAACQLHYENHDSVIKNCQQALDYDKENVKGLYRRGVAYSRLKDWDNASHDLRSVLDLDPGNKAAQRELHTVIKMLKEEKEREKVGQLAKGLKQMFS